MYTNTDEVVFRKFGLLLIVQSLKVLCTIPIVPIVLHVDCARLHPVSILEEKEEVGTADSASLFNHNTAMCSRIFLL